jgi:hypothetical protein
MTARRTVFRTGIEAARTVCRTGVTAASLQGCLPDLLVGELPVAGLCARRCWSVTFPHLQDGGDPIRALVFKTVAILALQGHFSASGGRAFLASPKSSPAVDGDGS